MTRPYRLSIISFIDKRAERRRGGKAMLGYVTLAVLAAAFVAVVVVPFIIGLVR